MANDELYKDLSKVEDVPSGTNGYECPRCGTHHAEVRPAERGGKNLRCLNEKCGYRWAVTK